MSRICSFSPVITKQARLLILGSMPGVESLRRQEYYANSHNQFWRIIFELFQSPVEQAYEQKLAFLVSHGIALWDVIASCYREGSLDTDIKDEEVNDFKSLFAEYSQIHTVCFNGGKAYQTYRKVVGLKPDMRYIRLESTSPANTKRYENKLENWSVIREYLSD